MPASSSLRSYHTTLVDKDTLSQEHDLIIKHYTMPDQTFHGSCHCGTIQYTLTLPTDFFSNPTAGRCNCTICQKAGFTFLRIPASSFTLTSPASKSELPDYQPKIKTLHLYFCNKCGVQVVREGSYELEGQKHEWFSVNLLTVDQPQEGIDLSKFKIKYIDGLHDNWMAGEKDEPWSGGCL